MLMPGAANKIIKLALRGLWQVLPLDLASGIGSVLVRVISLRYRKTTAATRQSLRHINPAYTEPELDRILSSMWENIGRVWAEALITRRLAARRLQIRGQEYLRLAKSTGRPIIVPFLHIGNWEIATSVLAAHNLRPHSIAEIQRRKVFDELINEMRGTSGHVVVMPDTGGIRQMYRYLERGDTMCIAIDEYKKGVVMGPSFGRPSAGPSNTDFVLRLAHKFKTVLLPMYINRLGGANFELHISPPLPPERLATVAGCDQIKLDLENWSEGIIRAHIDQWYMLHRLRFK